MNRSRDASPVLKTSQNSLSSSSGTNLKLNSSNSTLSTSLSASAPPSPNSEQKAYDIDVTKPEIQNQVEVLDEQPKSILMSLISQLKVGMDLSKVTLPTFILEPKSMLEKFTDFWTHGDLILDTLKIDDPYDRLIQVTKWYISGFYIRPKGVKKPYNPIIGEYFRCRWDHASDESTSYFIAEQVSHHPPISCFYCSNKKAGFVINGTLLPRSRFLGNSSAAVMEGSFSLYLMKYDEEYVFTFPNAYARGLLFGKLFMEFGDLISIKCEKNGFQVDIEFKTKGFLSGDYNVIDGRIKDKKAIVTKLSGKWDSVIYYKHKKGNHLKKTPTSKQVLWDPTGQVVLQKILPPLEEMGKYESTNIWSRVSSAIISNNQSEATEAKTALEEDQRERIKKCGTNDEWNPTFFHKTDKGGWEYNYFSLKPMDLETEEEREVKPGVILVQKKGSS